MSKRRVTLSDVARETGVSAITISRAFSDPNKVNPATLTMVLDCAKKLGYKPNKAARALKANKSKMIGVVNPNMSNPFFAHITKAIVEHSQKQGYDVLVFDSYESASFENKAIQTLIEHGVDGIILSTISSDMNYQPEYLLDLSENEIPFVLLDRELLGEYNGVYIDNMDSGYQLGRLIAQEFNTDNKIHILAAADNSMVSNNRIAGFRAALFEYDIAVYHGDFSIDLAYQTSLDILATKTNKPVLVGLNNQITLGIIKAVIEKGLVPQKDVIIYSIDAVPIADIFGIFIPSISHNLDEMAFQAVNSIMRLINEQQPMVNNVIIRGRLNTKADKSSNDPLLQFSVG